LIGGQYGTVRLLDVQTGQQLQVFFNHRQRVLSATFSPDGKHIYTTDWTVRAWDAAMGQLERSFDKMNGRDEVVISPDGKQILTDVGYWDGQSGQALHTFGQNGDLASVAFSSDGKQIVTGADLDGAVRLWDADSGTLLRSFFGHQGTVSSVAF